MFVTSISAVLARDRPRLRRHVLRRGRLLPRLPRPLRRAGRTPQPLQQVTYPSDLHLTLCGLLMTFM